MIHITNEGTTGMAIAGRCIPPGETKHFSASEVPLHLRTDHPPSPAESESTAQVVHEDDDDALQDLSRQPVNIIKDAMGSMDDAELVRLMAIEEAVEKPRATLIKIISETLLTRASQERDE